MKWNPQLFWLAVVLFSLSLAVGRADDLFVWWFGHEREALCDTDTDCMRFCPPPADDPDCDGGPEPVGMTRI